MFYFTGTRWSAGEPTFVLVMPAEGELAWIVPADAARARQAIRMGTDIRTGLKPTAPISGSHRLCTAAPALRERPPPSN